MGTVQEVEARGEDDEEELGEAALVPHQHEEGLGAAHQALLQREGPTGFQSFTKPPCFGARIAGLLGLMVVSWLCISLAAMLVPVWLGRHLFALWQDWALGAMYTKITVALTFMGPDWWLKESIEQLYQDGIRNLNLSRVVTNLVIPCVSTLGLSLCLPYLLSHGLAPQLISSEATLILVQRRIYPALLFSSALIIFFTVQARQFKKLVEHIKNDRYLVGRRLVNYNHGERREEVT